jgi:hypothetical protein
MSLLAAGAFGIAKNLCPEWKPRPFVALVLFWADLILTGHVCSLFQALDSLPIYFMTSILVMTGLWLFSKMAVKRDAPLLQTAPSLDYTTFQSEQDKRRLWYFLGGSLLVVCLINLFIVLTTNPTNADSIIYRFPRVFFYVSGGSFFHPFDALDKRLTYYPLDGTALYVPIVLHNAPAYLFNLPSILAWLVVGYGTYRFARELGAERLIAFLASWIVLCTPNINAQAASTNDEILAAVALLTSLYLGFSWLRCGERLFFVLACAAIGISAGTKMHILFLVPVVAIAMGIMVVKARKTKGLLKQWTKAVGWGGGLLGLTAMMVMYAPFFLYNYFSTGRAYFLEQSAHEVLNTSGSVATFVQNFVIYAMQMVFAPIGDLNMWPDAHERQIFDNFLNSITNPFILPFVGNTQDSYHASYRFNGVTIATSVRMVEYSLWAGFVWLLWPLQIRGTKSTGNDFALKPLFLLLAATPLIWLFVWSAMTLYMEGSPTYFAYFLIVAAPAASMAFLRIRRESSDKIRWFLVCFVVVSNLIIVGNYYAFCGFRSLPLIVASPKLPMDWLHFDQNIIDEIQRAKRIRVDFSHEKMPYFSFMRWNPRATYIDPYRPPESYFDTLEIVPASSMNQFGFMPLQIPAKKTLGLTLLGTIRGIGQEAIFAFGNDVHRRYPAVSNYILPVLTYQASPDGSSTVAIASPPLGYDALDNLEFKITILSHNRIVYSRDWQNSLLFQASLDTSPLQDLYILTFQVRDAATHAPVTEISYKVIGRGQWLEDDPE